MTLLGAVGSQELRGLSRVLVFLYRGLRTSRAARYRRNKTLTVPEQLVHGGTRAPHAHGS
jgi:hypothetical protein